LVLLLSKLYLNNLYPDGYKNPSGFLISDAINNSSTGLIKRVTDLENAGGDLVTKSVNIDISGTSSIYANKARVNLYGSGNITISKIVTPSISLYSWAEFNDWGESYAQATGAYHIYKNDVQSYYKSISTYAEYGGGGRPIRFDDTKNLPGQTITDSITLSSGEYLLLLLGTGLSSYGNSGNSYSFSGPFSVTYVKTDGMAIEVVLL